MFGSLIVLAAAASSAPSASDPFDRISVQEAAERVSECGLGSVAISHDDLLQEDILTAAEPPPLTDDQLACADRAASFYDLKLPVETQKRYDDIRNERLTTYFAAESRQWLSKRGLLDRLPVYTEGVTDPVTFTRQIEDLCGPLAKGAFQSSYGPRMMSSTWVAQIFKRGRKGMKALDCLNQVTMATRYDYGMIVEEQSAEPKAAAH